MNLNTEIRFEKLRGPDNERTATVCYNNLDGVGVVWGRYHFKMPWNGFGDELPEPDVMLKDVPDDEWKIMFFGAYEEKK